MRSQLLEDPFEVIAFARGIAEPFGGFGLILRRRAEAQEARAKRQFTALHAGTLLGAQVSITLTFDFSGEDDSKMTKDHPMNEHQEPISIARAAENLKRAAAELNKLTEEATYARNRFDLAKADFDRAVSELNKNLPK